MDNTAPHECTEMDRMAGGEKRDGSAGGSASRTISDSDAPDPGGGSSSGLETTEGWHPKTQMDPKCPGLPSFGEPHAG